MATETVHIHLKNCPADVKKLIEDEQARMKLFEGKKLKQEFVVYDMLREWYQLKSRPIEKTVETYHGTVNLNTGEVKSR